MPGFAAEVVERQRTWQEAGAGIYLPGNAARALRALDLEHAVVDKAVVITSQRVCALRETATAHTTQPPTHRPPGTRLRSPAERSASTP